MAYGAGAAEVSLNTYPWDLYDQGLDRAVRRIQSSGFNTVHLATAYHIGTYLLPQNPRRPIYWGNHGAVYFKPTPAFYEDGALLPRTAEMVEDNPQFMDEVMAALREAGLKVKSWTVYCYNHALARANSELTKHDCFGNPYQSQLCVGQPAVRGYARGLTRDIMEGLGMDGILLESLSYMRWNYGFLNTKQTIDPSPRSRYLLGLCFCSGCSAAAAEADLDLEALRRDVELWVRRDLNRMPAKGDLPPADDGWLQEAFDGRLWTLSLVRSQVVTSITNEMLDMTEAIRPGASSEHVAFGGGGFLDDDLASIRQRVSHVRIYLRSGKDAAAFRQEAQEIRAQHGPRVRLIGFLRPQWYEDRDMVKRTLDAAAEAGIENYRVYNFGVLTQRQLSWFTPGVWPVDA